MHLTTLALTLCAALNPDSFTAGEPIIVHNLAILPLSTTLPEPYDDYTVLEVKCPDRLGLLYLVTRALAGLGLDIATARIATEIDQAVDTFYVHDGRGRKIEAPESLGRVREAVEQALMQPI